MALGTASTRSAHSPGWELLKTLAGVHRGDPTYIRTKRADGGWDHFVTPPTPRGAVPDPQQTTLLGAVLSALLLGEIAKLSPKSSVKSRFHPFWLGFVNAQLSPQVSKMNIAMNLVTGSGRYTIGKLFHREDREHWIQKMTGYVSSLMDFRTLINRMTDPTCPANDRMQKLNDALASAFLDGKPGGGAYDVGCAVGAMLRRKLNGIIAGGSHQFLQFQEPGAGFNVQERAKQWFSGNTSPAAPSATT